MSASPPDATVRTERLRTLTMGRLMAASLLVGGLSTVGRELVAEDGWALLATAVLVHALVQAAALLLTTYRPGTSRVVSEVALVVDVAGVAVVLASTGGVVSPFAPLLLLEVVAITLLFGRWAGLRAALLGSLAVLWVLVSGPPSVDLAVSAIHDLDPSLAANVDPAARGLLLLVVLWITTAVTGWLSGVTERDLRGRADDLTLLREITPDLDPRLGPEKVAQAVIDVVVRRLGYPGAALWLAESEDRLGLVVEEGTRTHPTLLDADSSLPRDHPLLADDARPGVRPIRPDQGRPAALGDLFGPRTPLVGAPLRVDERTTGLLVIEVGTRTRRGPVVRARNLRVLRMLAEQAALLLDNARLQAELADQATTDAVTGLPNHRFFQQRLGEELDRISRRADNSEHRACSLALLDLDHFKRVNDTYGHPTGDRVLAAVARTIDDALRDSDVVCRDGGEEFAVVLVDTDAEGARLTCERLRTVVRDLTLSATDGRPIGRVTASFGVATVAGVAEPRASVVARADDALYAAKHGGRDQIVHHDDLPVPDLATGGAGPGPDEPVGGPDLDGAVDQPLRTW